MASTDLKTFIEDRLRVLDPAIDLDPGSPAQTQFVEPLLSYLGTDPFETDIRSFLLDRFAQEFPDVYAGDPSVVDDTFVKPLTLMLEPLKREIQTTRRGQSLEDPSLLSDEDADAIAANWFSERSSGGYARGVARALFSNPTNIQIEVTTRFYTADGLSFFPTNPRAVTAEEMVFNRQGALYFVDIPTQAEEVGTEYNIPENTITGVEGLFNPVQVTNPREFTDGSIKVDTPTFIASTREGLNERSLVTRRGAVARINNDFQGEVRAVQVIGAGDPEMQRDILVATSPGHAWLTGTVSIYDKIAFVQCSTVDDTNPTPTVSVGDTVYIYLDKYSNGAVWAALVQENRFIRFTVEEVLAGPMEASLNGFQVSYVVRFSGEPPAGVVLPNPVTVSGGLSKKGTVKISSLPSVGQSDFTVNNQEVHVFGHTDIYARPVLQSVSTTVLDSIVNDPTIGGTKIQRQVLETFGAAVSDKNKVTDSTFDFGLAGVEELDILIIETGDDAGSYTIIKVAGNDLFLSQNLSKTATNIRYSIIRNINVNPFAPRILKFPFGDIPNNDMQTLIGSNALTVTNPSTNLIEFGVRSGDVVLIKDGPDAGEYTIQGFSTDGKQLTVDRALTSTSNNLTYEIYTALETVARPLVRIKDLLVLDSAKQSSGVTIPPADPVGVVATCDLTSAKVRGKSQAKSGYILPALTKADGSDDYVTGGNVAAVSGDRRYSLGFDPTNGGTYKAMQFDNATLAEFLFAADADRTCSYFLATSEDSSFSENFPPMDPKPGDALTIKNGPNKGSYLIKSVYKFKHTTSGKFYWSYFIKIYGTFPVDIIRSLIEFFDDVGVSTTGIKISNGSGTIAFPSFFTSAYASFGTKLDAALTLTGTASPGATALQAIFDSLASVDYEWGDPARGNLRSYFLQPTLFQQHTAESDSPTTFSFKTQGGDLLKYRADPNRYDKYEVVPPRVSSDTDPLDYYRDYEQNGTTASFTDTARLNLRAIGIKEGDTLSIHPEVYFHGSTGQFGTDIQTAVQTIAGSARISAPATASGSVFDASMVGNLLFIDEGLDLGAYRVVEFIDVRTLSLDRPLTRTTPAIIAEGSGASWGYDGSNDKVVAPGTPFTAGHINKYLTLYGIDTTYQGSYKITAVPASNTAVVERTGSFSPQHFPAYPVTAVGRWVITDAPATALVPHGASTDLSGLQPIRMYNDVTIDEVITTIPTDPDDKTVTAGNRNSGVKEPYRIFRSNVRRITPSEMALNTDGPFFYFDTEVVSLGPGDAFNLGEGSYLTIDGGTYESNGYRHVVDDNTLTYSTKETGHLEIPNKILPLETPDSADNFINLSGVPIQIKYEASDLIAQLQAFIESPEDRSGAANMLARHFLPSYASMFATYSGGSAPSVIAKDIISYIDSLSIETVLDVSEIQKLITQRGGNPETPLKVFLLIHDWDRKQWVEVSTNSLGGTDIQVPYNGTPKVGFAIPGPDLSGVSPLPYGEAIVLTRL